jgi:hypothetical protein
MGVPPGVRNDRPVRCELAFGRRHPMFTPLVGTQEEHVTTFDERERAFENLFAHDEELRFRAVARRNKAVAAWAAARMGRTGEAAARYQAEILAFGLGHADDGALVDRLVSDLTAAGQSVDAAEVRAEVDRGLADAVAHEKSA